MPQLLDYETPRRPEPVPPGVVTLLLSVAVPILWGYSMFTWAVGDFDSNDPSAFAAPGFALACVMFPWWPANLGMAVMPLTVLAAARGGANDVGTVFRLSLVSLAGAAGGFVVMAAWHRTLDPSLYGRSIPLWFAAHTVACLCLWRLSRDE